MFLDNKVKNKRTAYALLRITMGINILVHGLIRLPKTDKFRDWMLEQFINNKILPSLLVYVWGSVLPIIEFVIGLFVLIGFFTYKSCVAGAILIAILILGTCINEKWEWVNGQMIYALFFYFLIANAHFDSFSMDNLFKRKSQ